MHGSGADLYCPDGEFTVKPNVLVGVAAAADVAVFSLASVCFSGKLV